MKSEESDASSERFDLLRYFIRRGPEQCGAVSSPEASVNEINPKGAPNVVIFLLDDTGFGQIGSFGGLVSTPDIDKLAAGGLRYNNFHTTALCSPSRATLMAGRNPHTNGLGSHALTAMEDER